MRYFDLKTRTETLIKSDTTVEYTDDRVKGFFEPLADGYELTFDDNGYPLIVEKTVQTQEEIETINILMQVNEYKTYLSSTDWYIARQVETGEGVPESIVLKRAEAREFIRSQENA